MRRAIWLQTPAAFWQGGGKIPQIFNVLEKNDVNQIEIHTSEPEPSDFEFRIVIEKLKDTNHQVLIKSRQD
jgi:hypothetical protein